MPTLTDLRKQSRAAAVAMATILLVANIPSVSAGAQALNEVQLDNGYCGTNLQIGSDHTASSSATPSFLLAGDGGLSIYRIFIDGNLIGTFNSDGSAKVCIYTTTRLSEGRHQLTGNEVQPHNTYTVVPFDFSVDTSVPPPPTPPTISGYSDLGVLGDGITKWRGMNFTGTAEPGTSVQLYRGGVTGIGGALTDPTGHWSVTTQQLADGTYSITAAAFDGAGNKSGLSMAVTVTVDGTAPGAPPAPTLDPASDTSPQGDNATTILTPKVVGTGAGGAWKVTVFVDGSQVGVVMPDASGNWNYTLPTQTVATHAVTATLTDVADNQGVASTALNLSITTGTPPPTVPGAPTLISATPGAGQVSLAWTAPRPTAARPSPPTPPPRRPGGFACTTGGLGCTVVGLTNGTSYTFTVTATNAAGTGPASSPSAAVTPRTVPGAPTGVSATAGSGQASVVWTAPASNGGAVITSYTATSSPGGFTCTTSGLGCTVVGLTNGTAYTFTVTAKNVAGTGPASSPSAAVTPTAAATVPGAPTGVSGTPGNGTVTVAWSAPASNGGSPITGYSAMANNGASCFTAGTTCTVNGLTNGIAYTFTVTATNVVGTGPASSPSAAVTPRTVPGAPTLSSATAGNSSVALAWTAPASNGGATITGYRATASPGGAVCTTTGGLGCTVVGLTNGTSYTFTVSATNAAGTGPASNSLSATPTAAATVPGAPTGVVAAPGNGQASVTWTAPASNGGSPITGYTAMANNGASCSTTGMTCTVNGLTNGTAYTFTVSATNAVGTGPASSPSAAVTPRTVPGAPTITSVAPGSTAVNLAWTAPASNGGAAITSYTATSSPGGFTCTTSGLSCTVVSLTNGTAYTFTVTATNAAGTGPASSPSAAVTPRTVPGAPTGVSATAGSGQASVVLDRPASNGGAVITSYTATSSPGGLTCTTSGLGCTVVGLTNGTAYTFTVTAKNVAGTGPASSPSAAVTPTAAATVPGAPTITSAVPGNSVTITWSAPANDGGAAITNYRIYRGTSSGGESLLITVGRVTTYTDTTTTGGTTYYYQVAAVNGAGEGPRSGELSATPMAPPGAPTITSVTAGNGSASLAWSAPANNGGSQITSYSVFRGTTSGGETILTTVGNVTGWTDTGLVNGTTYFYKVAAANIKGAGAPSNEKSATPIGSGTVPGAPQNVGVKPNEASGIVLTWKAPKKTGSSPIVGYKIYRASVSKGETYYATVGNVLTFTDTHATNGTTYYYQISAVNGTGEGALTTETSAARGTAPTAPRSLTSSAGTGTVDPQLVDSVFDRWREHHELPDLSLDGIWTGDPVDHGRQHHELHGHRRDQGHPVLLLGHGGQPARRGPGLQ